MKQAEGPFAKIAYLAVRKEAQKQGIGTAMVKLIEKDTIKAGHKGIVVSPDSGALDFYAKCGYQIDSDAAEMYKDLFSPNQKINKGTNSKHSREIITHII